MSLHRVVDYSVHSVRINSLTIVVQSPANTPAAQAGNFGHNQPPTLARAAGWFHLNRVQRSVHHDTDPVCYSDSFRAGKTAPMPWIAADWESTYSLDFRQLQSAVVQAQETRILRETRFLFSRWTPPV